MASKLSLAMQQVATKTPDALMGAKSEKQAAVEAEQVLAKLHTVYEALQSTENKAVTSVIALGPKIVRQLVTIFVRTSSEAVDAALAVPKRPKGYKPTTEDTFLSRVRTVRRGWKAGLLASEPGIIAMTSDDNGKKPRGFQASVKRIGDAIKDTAAGKAYGALMGEKIAAAKAAAGLEPNAPTTPEVLQWADEAARAKMKADADAKAAKEAEKNTPEYAGGQAAKRIIASFTEADVLQVEQLQAYTKALNQGIANALRAASMAAKLRAKADAKAAEPKEATEPVAKPAKATRKAA